MDNTYEFELSEKDYAKIMRWQRRWLSFAVFGIIGLEFLFAIISALAYIYKWPVGFYPLIALVPLTALGAFACFKAIVNGGAKNIRQMQFVVH